MKKIRTILLLTLLSLVFVFAGCEDENERPEPAKLVGLSLSQTADDYVKTFSAEMVQKLKAQGYTLLVTNADGKLENQQKQIDALLKQGVNAMLVASPDGDLSESIAQIKGASIPVINVVNAFSDVSVDASIFNNANGEGKTAADHINSLLTAGVYQIMYTTGANTEQERTQWITGITDNLSASITRFTSPLAVVDSLSALNRAKTIISRDIQVCVALDDTALQGFVTALKESAKTLDDVKLIVFSGSPKSKKLLKEGRISAIVARSPLKMAELASTVCTDLIHGTGVEPNTLVEGTLITAQNIGEYDENIWE